MSYEEKLQFVPFRSCVDPSFWHKLAQVKLDVDKLSEPIRKIWGYHCNVAPRGLNGILSIDCSSFNTSPEKNDVVSFGKLINKNTLDNFKGLDTASILSEEGRELVESFRKDALDRPELLSRFLIVCFADIKYHKFVFWFAFPAIQSIAFQQRSCPQLAKDFFSPGDLNTLNSLIDRRRNYCVLNTTKGAFQVHDVRDGFKRINEGLKDFILVCADSCNDTAYPGWPLRNYLALFAYHCQHKEPVKALCLRLKVIDGIFSIEDSLVLTVAVHGQDEVISWSSSTFVGWERNAKGAYGPRQANLHSSMSPLALAESSVDLNLKLMKWQVMPDLDLDVVKNVRCLLLGAGTLGCAVARCLLGWGVRTISFVDSANVSYSNPVRQNLYQFNDVGKSKALAAAAALKAIFPSVVSEGKTFCIPMPGHPVGESLIDDVTQAISMLDEMIKSHDVIFLLMDSRESRWLPTVMGAAHNKIVINAALGFDSYLVMRHGMQADACPAVSAVDGSSSSKVQRLGCYFCSDVTAPGNSGQARTLDQQCTVTRPGVSNIAGSLAVELMVSILQNSGKNNDTAIKTADNQECILGKIPHSIRGFLNQFENMLLTVEAFSSCVGCSETVVSEYRTRGTSFVFDVLDSKKYLEDLTGLSKLHQESILDDVLILSDEDDEDT